MENFIIEHTNLGTNFCGKFHNRRVSFDLKYFKTHNNVPLSVNVFVDGLPNSATLTIKIFQSFHKKNISLNLNMLIYFKTFNN